MASQNLLQTLLQSLDIERASQTNKNRDVIVRTSRKHFIQEPQALLGKREGKSLLPLLYSSKRWLFRKHEFWISLHHFWLFIIFTKFVRQLMCKYRLQLFKYLLG